MSKFRRVIRIDISYFIWVFLVWEKKIKINIAKNYCCIIYFYPIKVEIIKILKLI